MEMGKPQMISWYSDGYQGSLGGSGTGTLIASTFLARIMHRFLSRSDESDDLARRTIEAPANVLYGTLRRPTECNAGRADDFVGAVENLCIIRV